MEKKISIEEKYRISVEYYGLLAIKVTQIDRGIHHEVSKEALELLFRVAISSSSQKLQLNIICDARIKMFPRKIIKSKRQN